MPKMSKLVKIELWVDSPIDIEPKDADELIDLINKLMADHEFGLANYDWEYETDPDLIEIYEHD